MWHIYIQGIFFFKIFICQRESTSRGSSTEGEAGSLLRKPNAGIDPRTLGSPPELKADA